MPGFNGKNAPIGNPVKNKRIVESGLAQLAKCDCIGGECCPCPHYVLGELTQDKDLRIYLWNDGGVLKSGLKADFEAACEAAKSE